MRDGRRGEEVAGAVGVKMPAAGVPAVAGPRPCRGPAGGAANAWRPRQRPAAHGGAYPRAPAGDESRESRIAEGAEYELPGPCCSASSGQRAGERASCGRVGGWGEGGRPALPAASERGEARAASTGSSPAARRARTAFSYSAACA